MLGVILAGGTGSRLAPLTNTINKGLLPVYDKPMVWHPITTLVNSGVEEAIVVCGGNESGQFINSLRNGTQFGLKRLNYAVQPEPNGIVGALSMVRGFAGDEPIAVVLADNIFEDTFEKEFKEFDDTHKNRVKQGWKSDGLSGIHANIFATEVGNPSAYGVVTWDKDQKVTSIIEKPSAPASNHIAVGLYLYSPIMWDYIDRIEPSERGELEITDLNNIFLSKDQLKVNMVNGQWADAGESIEGYLDCCTMTRDFGKKEN